MDFMIKDKIGGLPMINDIAFKPTDEGHWLGGPVGADAAAAFKDLPHRFEVDQVAKTASTPAPAPKPPAAPKTTGGGRSKKLEQHQASPEQETKADEKKDEEKVDEQSADTKSEGDGVGGEGGSDEKPADEKKADDEAF